MENCVIQEITYIDEFLNLCEWRLNQNTITLKLQRRSNEKALEQISYNNKIN